MIMYRPVRRRAGAGRGADGVILSDRPRAGTAAEDCPRKHRAAEAQPGDLRAPVQAWQRLGSRRAAGEIAVPEHARHDPADRGQPAPDAERAFRAARRPTGSASGNGGGTGTHPADRTGDRRRHAGRDEAASPRRAYAEMRLPAQSALIGVSVADLWLPCTRRWAAARLPMEETPDGHGRDIAKSARAQEHDQRHLQQHGCAFMRRAERPEHQAPSRGVDHTNHEPDAEQVLK